MQKAVGISLLCLTACVATQPPQQPSAASSTGADVPVGPVVDPTVMEFQFPFRGITYQMTVEEGQSGLAGTIYTTPAPPVDAATAKTAVLNACAFIGRFPDATTTGQQMAGSAMWTFERACL